MLAFGLLILYHTGMVFVTWDFHVKNGQTSRALEYPMLFVNQWRLPLLFLVSGASTRFALGARPAGVFIRQRLVRLLLPLAFGIAVVIPPQVYCEQLSRGRATGPFLEFYPHFFNGIAPRGNFTWTHLWFVAYLLTFSLLALPLFLADRRAGETGPLAATARFLARPWALWLPALPLAGLFLLLRQRWPDVRNLVTDWYNFSFFLTVFVLGYLLVGRAGFRRTVERHALALLAAGGALTAGLFFFYWHDTIQDRQVVFPGTPGYALYAGVKMLHLWTWMLAFLGLACRFLTFRSPWLAYGNEAVYPFYILHQTVLLVLAVFVTPLDWGIAPKFLALAAGTFLGTLAIYEGAVRRVPVLRLLFGMKPRARGPGTRS